MDCQVRQTSDPADADWLTLRGEFFPEDEPGEHERFLQAAAGGAGRFTAFVAADAAGRLLGFAEVAVRQDYVNGCRFRPALFLEGIFVRPESRGRGIAHQLIATAAAFGRQQGCREFASDVFMDDSDSLAAHAGLGFEETERVVYFRMPLEATTRESSDNSGRSRGGSQGNEAKSETR